MRVFPQPCLRAPASGNVSNPRLPSESWESIWKSEDVTETRADCSGGQGWRRGLGDNWRAAVTTPVERALRREPQTRCPEPSAKPPWGPHSHPAGSSDFTNEGDGSEKVVKELAQDTWLVSGRVGTQPGLSSPDPGL